ncbi:MAG: 16S rRNA (guanine(527)-N(7))-methyltransferase RsmG [Rickettsia sp.]|nr:16S rRNA (guanine(527)-N(7))-methyltransferase RsmG [Rickettsia sp.]
MFKDVSRETFKSIDLYRKFLLQWNQKFNLISRNSQYLLSEHIEDAMSLMEHISCQSISLMDLGSGNGMPGLILSILGVTNVTLIESSKKKTSFLLQAKKFSKNNIFIFNEFITYKNQLECDILVSRAYGKLEKILYDTQNFFVKDKYLLIKGQNLLNEISSAQENWNFEYKIHDIKKRDFTKILELKNLSLKKR